MDTPDTGLGGQNTTASGRLYMAFELGEKNWKLSLGDGQRAPSHCRKSSPSVVRQLIQHWRNMLLAIGITVGGTVAFYTYTVYMQKFPVNSAGLSKGTSTLVTTGALLLYLALQPLFALASDLIGRRPVLILFGSSCTLFPVPLFEALSRTKSTVTIFMLCFAGLPMLSSFTSIHMRVKTELFPARIRALAVGLPYALTTAILGGTADLSRCGSRRSATSRTSSGT